MADKVDVGDLDLSDAELLEILKNHGLSRRVLMKVFGLGAVGTALGGNVAGKRSQVKFIDDVYGAPYSATDTVPGSIVHKVVELDFLAPEGGDGEGNTDTQENGDSNGEGYGDNDGQDDGDTGTQGDGDSDGVGVHPGFPDPDDAIPEFIFDPVGLHVRPGSIVEFRNVSLEHTATAFHEKWSNPQLSFPTRVPGDVPGFTSPPFVDDESWLYRFTTKGVYDIFCFPHLTFGMTMRVVVFDPNEDSLDDQRFDDWGPFPELTQPEQPFYNVNRVLTADSLDPATIVDRGQVAWADLSL